MFTFDQPQMRKTKQVNLKITDNAVRKGEKQFKAALLVLQKNSGQL